MVAVVEHVQRLTPRMIRIVFGGEGLAGFAAGEFTDHYVKLRIGERTRTYTVREWDGGRLTIDFVVHGDEGVAGPWAAAARPRDLRLARAGAGGAVGACPAPGQRAGGRATAGVARRPARAVAARGRRRAARRRGARARVARGRGLPRESVSISGYWKRKRTEEGWREDKPEWNRLVEADLTAA